MTSAEPHRQDILIRHEPDGRFTIGTCGGSPQLECSTFAEALRRGGDFATRAHLDSWYVGNDRSSRRLADVCALRTFWNQYVELPGLRLTFSQARGLMAVDASTCGSVLDSLLLLKFLQKSPDRAYVRSSKPYAAVAPLRLRRVPPEMATTAK